MSHSLEFEFLLLSRMSAEYIAEVLEQNRHVATSIAKMQEASVIRLPLPIGVSIEHYEKALGRPVAIHKIPGPITNQEYLRHDFSLELWPHLVWSMATVDGLVFGYGFRARNKPYLDEFRQEFLKSGYWCFDDLKELGAQWIQVDGWGEDGDIMFKVGRVTVEGTHCFGLFYQWRIINT